MKNESEKIIFDFSMKKCEKNEIYHVSIESPDKSLGISGTFQTEKLICDKDNSDLHFETKLILNFNFANVKQELNIICYKKNNKSTRFTKLDSIISSPNSVYQRPLNENKKDRDILCISANKLKGENENKITIFDFLKSGVKFNVFIGYDFSKGVNKKPRIPSFENYSDMTKDLINPMHKYISRQSIYFYGYGGINSKSKEDLFNLFSEEDIPISYEKVRSQLELVLTKDIKKPNKTVFLSKLIRKVTKMIYKLYQLRNFNILFIFAKELPDKNDKQDLIDSIIESSYLPLIIIIIGEGKNDFKKFEEYFGEKIKVASNGMEKNRDNILYFESKGNEDNIAQWCLEAISKHILEFYNLVKCNPEQIWKDNMKAIEQSYMFYNKVSVCIFESHLGNSQMNSIIGSQDKNEIVKSDEHKDNVNKKIGDDIPTPESDDMNNINKKIRIIDYSINNENANANINNPYTALIAEKKIKKKEMIKEKPEEIKKIEQKEEIKNKNEIKIEEKKEEKIEEKKDEIIEEKKEEKKEKKEEEDKTLKKYKLTPGQSVCTFFPNPYNKENQEEEDKEENKERRVLIPNQSIIDNKVYENTYANKKTGINQSNDSKVDSSTSTIENSRLNNSKNKASNLPVNI